MPKRIAPSQNLHSLVEDFVKRIVSVVDSATTHRIQTAVGAALSTASGSTLAFPRRRGRPPKNGFSTTPLFSSAPARRRPKQLCPVPGCNNAAAPVFGMVCGKHKDVPKTQIRKHRADRRAAKGNARAAA